MATSKEYAITPADFATDFIAGLLGGSAGLIVGHPFDTVKVILQTSKSNTVTSTSCIRMVLKQYGAKGLYKGMSYPLASVGFLNSIFFGFHMITESKITGFSSNCYIDVFMASALAGGIQAVPATPIEQVKVKLQAQLHQSLDPKIRREKYTGSWDCMKKIYNAHGVQGLFRGLSPTVVRDVTGFSVYMTVYMLLRDSMTTDSQDFPSFRVMLLAGGVAGVLSWMANLPIDNIKTRMQNDSLQNPVYRNALHCLRVSLNEEGFRALWKGSMPTICRAFPLNAVTLCTYDWTQQQMKIALKNHKVNRGLPEIVRDIQSTNNTCNQYEPLLW